MERLVEEHSSRPDFDRLDEASVRPMGELVRKVVKGGGVVIAGTDSPIFPVRAPVPHRARDLSAERADAV